MHIFTMKLRNAALGAAVGAVMSLSAFAGTGSEPLGSLSAENGVSVVSETGELRIENTYSYFGGDTIVTGDKGLAGLTLGDDGGVYVGKKSSASVRRVNGEYVVELKKGSVGFSFEAGVPFKVVASGKVVRSANGKEAVSGAVELNAKGEVAVRSMSGDLVADGATGRLSVVNAGEAYALAGDENRLVKVDVTDDSEVPGDYGPWIIGGTVLFGGILIATKNDDGDASPSK